MIRRNIPNIITLSNLFCGLCSIWHASEGNLIASGALILTGALLDFLDGFIARLLNAYSEFGKQLDSLADMITFGLAPATILLKFLEIVDLPIIISVLIPMCSAIRLAKFNSDNQQTNYFIGLPTPALGIFIAALALNYEHTLIFYNDQLLLIISFLLPALLISNIKLFSFKFNKEESFNTSLNICRIVLITSSLVLFFLFWFAAIPFIVILYFILSIINNTIS